MTPTNCYLNLMVVTPSVLTLQAFVFTQIPNLLSTGTVTFYSGSTVIGSSTPQVPITLFACNLPTGTQDLWAQYNGYGVTYSSSQSIHYPTDLNNQSTNTYAILSSVASGNNTVLSVEVYLSQAIAGISGSVEFGSVDFYAHETPIGYCNVDNSGKCSITVSLAGVSGINDIFAVYYEEQFESPLSYYPTVETPPQYLSCESNHLDLSAGGTSPIQVPPTTTPTTFTPNAASSTNALGPITDNRVTWSAEFPAYTWFTVGWEYKLKQLNGGELWVDSVAGTVDIDVYYREDADPCWRVWFHTSICSARNCQEAESATACYPGTTFRESYKYPVVFPQPPAACDSMAIRPTTIGYQFQVKVVLKGWCRIRGLILYALPHEKSQFEGVTQAGAIPAGMSKLPNPFAQ